jgi:hypothetical protein
MHSWYQLFSHNCEKLLVRINLIGWRYNKYKWLGRMESLSRFGTPGIAAQVATRGNRLPDELATFMVKELHRKPSTSTAPVSLLRPSFAS